MKFSRFFSICLILLVTSNLKSQIGNEFWFAAPDVSHLHGNPTHVGDGSPIYFQITAVHATHVKISKPADLSFTAVEFDLNAQETKSVLLYKDPLYVLPETSVFANVSDIEVAAEDPSDLSKFIQSKGFLIESFPGEITAYYDLNSNLNREIFALKHSNALGQEFFVSTQNRFDNGYNDAISGFVVVATKDGTQVTINPNGNSLFEIPVTTTFTLNRGETFAVKANSRTAANHLQGVIVTSTRPIAVTIYDDSDSKQRPAGTSMDIIGDQTIPSNLIGKEYIVMRGDLYSTGSEKGDRVFFTATQPNTNIHIERSDGVVVANIPIASIGGGANYPIETTCDWIMVTADKPIYIIHVSGAGGGGEIGGSVLPMFDGCAGSHTVTVKRGSNTTDFLVVNLMARNDNVVGSPTHNMAANNFKVTVTTSTTIDSFRLQPIDFYYTPDSSWIILKPSGRAKFPLKILPGAVFRVDNPVARFHLGFQNGGTSNGGKYGYFSDYASSNASAGIGGAFLNKWGIYCNLDPIQLVADGSSSYQWYSTNYPSARLSDSIVADPWFYPEKTGIFLFNVIVDAECYGIDTIKDLRIIVTSTTDANYSLTKDVGCSPFTAQITNLANSDTAVNQIWTIEDQSGLTIFHEIYDEFTTKPTYFEYKLPDNNTDTVQKYSVRFVTMGIAYSCPSEMIKEVSVYPNLTADFTMPDSVPIGDTVFFTNLSSGTITNYLWSFGDGQSSVLPYPKHVYNSSVEKTFDIKLKAFTPTCSDSTLKSIKVYKELHADFTLSSTQGCSLITVDFINSSQNAESYLWDFGNGTTSTLENPTSSFLNNELITKIFAVKLIAFDNDGNSDTIQKLISVYPEMQADFLLTNVAGCQPLETSFINNSTILTGSQFDWYVDEDFYSQAITPIGIIVQNLTNNDVTHAVKLIAQTSHGCSDTVIQNFTVYSLVDAYFTVDRPGICSGDSFIIDRNFIRGGITGYNWNFNGEELNTNSIVSFYHSFDNVTGGIPLNKYITLTVNNAHGCDSAWSTNITVYPKVTADFDFNNNTVYNPNQLLFTNNSINASQYYWTFGDGENSSETSPVHWYEITTNTSFHIRLKATSIYNCEDTVGENIVVLKPNPHADFITDINLGCSPLTINFTNTSDNTVTYFWDFGNGQTSTEVNPVINFVNPSSLTLQLYTIQLIAFDGVGNSDTINKSISVYPSLDADFTVSPQNGMCPLQVTFTNLTEGADGFIWEYGDGLVEFSTESPVHVYRPCNDADFNAQLIASSVYGCIDTIVKSIHVDKLPFVSGFLAVDTIGNSPLTVTFTENSSNILSRRWELPDGRDVLDSTEFSYTFINNSQNDTIFKIIHVGFLVCYDSAISTQDIYVLPHTNGLKFGSPVNVSFYPNPVNETAFIQLNHQFKSPVKIEIYDQQGQLILNTVEEFDDKTNQPIAIDLERLNTGLYLLKIGDLQNQVYLKIIKK